MTSHEIYHHITQQILTLMAQEGTDWTRPWSTHAGTPSNFLTGAHYKGVNTLLLGLAAHAQGYDIPVWGTFKQWRLKGGSVRRGEHGTLGVFYKLETFRKEDTGEEAHIPVLKHFFLFNAAQVDGIEIPPSKPLPEVERNAEVDDFIASTGAVIHEQGHRAFYRPKTDQIWMPVISAFRDQEAFYSTLLHELSHWTGHPSRLNREEGMKGRFGDEAYAMEELVAELGACFLGIQLQVSHEPRRDHAQYLNNWMQVLKNDPRAFSSAASKAQAAADYLLGPSSLTQAAA